MLALYFDTCRIIELFMESWLSSSRHWGTNIVLHCLAASLLAALQVPVAALKKRYACASGNLAKISIFLHLPFPITSKNSTVPASSRWRADARRLAAEVERGFPP